MLEHTHRVLHRMISELIIPYREGKASLQRVISGLEGSLSVLEEKLPEDFHNRIDNYICDLDIILALGQEKSQFHQLIEILNELEVDIREELDG